MALKRLKKVANQHIIRRRVRLDGHAFIGCTFVDCILEFSGGDVSIEDTLFVRPAIEMDGPASNTTEVLRVLGALKEEMFTFADEKP
jgi:hypothetical protein